MPIQDYSFICVYPFLVILVFQFLFWDKFFQVNIQYNFIFSCEHQFLGHMGARLSYLNQIFQEMNLELKKSMIVCKNCQLMKQRRLTLRNYKQVIIYIKCIDTLAGNRVLCNQALKKGRTPDCRLERKLESFLISQCLLPIKPLK